MKKRKRNNIIEILDEDLDKYKLHVDGFEIITFYDPSITGGLFEEIKEIGDEGRKIFNNKFNGGDGKRKQSFLIKHYQSKELKYWLFSLRCLLKSKYPNLNPKDIVVIKSEKGCKRQLAHCDYPQNIEFARCDDENIPLGCLVCVDENTTIDVWQKSIKIPCLAEDLVKKVKPIERTTLKLEIGDIFVFRGDLVHAGSAYKTDNYRVHLFLDSKSVKRNKNTTWYMNKAKYILDGN